MSYRLRRSLAIVAGFASFAIPLTASAQGTGTTTDQPPAATPATPAPTEPAPAAAAKEDPPPPSGGHFRWGISPMLGTFFPGPTTFALGIEARFGWALNDKVSIYAPIGAVAGIGIGGESNAQGASVSVSAVSYWYIGANIDAMIAGPLFVGGGAGIGRGAFGIVSASGGANGGSTEVTAAGGTMPSVNARLGIVTGSPNKVTGKRSGFMLALDVRMLVGLDAVSTKTSGNSTAGGSQTTTDSTTALGFAPMLLIGYESR